jgi:hypothetical protein
MHTVHFVSYFQFFHFILESVISFGKKHFMLLKYSIIELGNIFSFKNHLHNISAQYRHFLNSNAIPLVKMWPSATDYEYLNNLFPYNKG